MFITSNTNINKRSSLAVFKIYKKTWLKIICKIIVITKQKKLKIANAY